MKIKFTKKRLLANLILGIIWIDLATFNVLQDDNLRWSDYGYLAIGILYVGHYQYALKNQYLTIENGIIRKNELYGFRKKKNMYKIN